VFGQSLTRHRWCVVVRLSVNWTKVVLLLDKGMPARTTYFRCQYA